MGRQNTPKMTRATPKSLRIAPRQEDDRCDCIETLSFVFPRQECSLELQGERYISFFFKQKTAYEIGLGIPAEPLFRSTMTNLSTECLIQLTKLGYDATPFNQILKQNAKREMRLRLGKVTVADVLAAQPVTTNLLKFMRASIKM